MVESVASLECCQGCGLRAGMCSRVFLLQCWLVFLALGMWVSLVVREIPPVFAALAAMISQTILRTSNK